MTRFWKSLTFFCFLIFLIGLCLPGLNIQAQAPDTGKVPRFEAADCPMAVPPTVRCGYLIVLEDRSNPASRVIRLGIAILKSRSANPAPDPLVYLEGGPGGSALAYLPDWVDSPFLDKRDFILVEQRGVNLSDPALNCPEVGEVLFDNFSLNLSQDEEIAREVQAATLCRDRLRKAGINLAAYNSAASAADLNDLRQVLGYAQWNLYSVSYGTRLALTTMRDWPEGIRSVILDSAYPPQAKSFVERIALAGRAFEVLVTACAEDAACNAAYPNFKTTLYDLIERLDAHPLSFNSVHPFTGQPVTLQITGGDLAGILYVMLYDPTGVKFAPFLIDQINRGNGAVLEPTAQQVLGILTAVTWGMFYSVECNERAPFGSASDVAAADQAYPALRNFLVGRSSLAICNIWGAGQAGDIENQPVHSAIPTLVLAGEYDPTTPPIWSKDTADTLSHSYFYLFTGQSHAVSFRSDCGQGMALAFFDNPQTAPDSSCMAGLRRARFIVPSDIYVTPALYRLNVDLLARRDLGQLAILGLCLTFFLAEIPLWFVTLIRLLFQAFRRGNRLTQPSQPSTPRASAARLIAVLAVLLNLIFVIGLVINTQQLMQSEPTLLGFGLSSAAAPLFLIPPLTAVLAVALLVFALVSWRKGWWSAVGRVRFSLVTAAALVFTFWLLHWGLLRL